MTNMVNFYMNQINLSLRLLYREVYLRCGQKNGLSSSEHTRQDAKLKTLLKGEAPYIIEDALQRLNEGMCHQTDAYVNVNESHKET